MKLSKRRTGRTGFRIFSFVGMALVLVFSGGASPGVQEAGDHQGFLVGALIKTWALRKQIAADIETNDRELQTSERIFQEAETRMTNATETHNRQATWEARGPLDKARADLKKAKQARTRLDQANTRAEASYAAVRSMLVSGQGKGPDSSLCGLLSLCSGKAKLIRKNGDQVTLDAGRPRFLEPGDEIMTTGGVRAEAQVLDGRAILLLDENSRLKLEEDGPEKQIVRLVQGKIYMAVDRPEDFTSLLQGSEGYFEKDPELKEAVARNQDRIRDLTNRTFLLRTPSACCAVRGAKFTVSLVKNGGTEIAVLEATLEAGEAECSNPVPVEAGFKVSVTRGSVSGPQKAADIDRWWEK
jgi:hypothetical protein